MPSNDRRVIVGDTPFRPGETLYPPIQTKLIEIMREVRAITKDKTNSHQNYTFRGIESVLSAFGPVFRQHEVFLTSRVLDIKNDQLAARQPMNHFLVTVEYTAHTRGGDSLVLGTTVGEAWDSSDKGLAKAMSVALRTLLIQCFVVPVDDPDLEVDYQSEQLAAPDKTQLLAQIGRVLRDKGWSKEDFEKDFYVKMQVPVEDATAEQILAYRQKVGA